MDEKKEFLKQLIEICNNEDQSGILNYSEHRRIFFSLQNGVVSLCRDKTDTTPVMEYNSNEDKLFWNSDLLSVVCPDGDFKEFQKQITEDLTKTVAFVNEIDSWIDEKEIDSWIDEKN